MSNHVFSEAEIAQLPDRVRTNFVNSLSGFKSANLIGTTSAAGVNNLAIVSSVFHVGANPALIGMIMRPHSVARDTLSNIKETSVFTINHVHADIVEKAHQCAARYKPDIDEFIELGLTAEASTTINAPFVAESRIKIAVELVQITPIALNHTEIVIGRIVEVSIDDDYVHADGYVDIEKAGSIAVSSLDSYHKTKRIGRYSYPKPKTPLHSIWQENNDPKS